MPSIMQPPLQGALTSLSCVDELIPAGESFSQILNRCTIQTTVKGEAEITVDGRPMTHHPGNLLAVATGVDFYEISTKPWHLRYIMLEGPWCEPLITALRANGGAMMLDRPPQPWLNALGTVVDAGITGDTGSTWRVAAALAALLGGLSANTPGEGDLLSEIGRLVDGAPERPWNITALARSLRIAPRTLQQRFRNLTGDGPAHWVLQRRMEHATHMLQRGMAVKDTAERLGFANQFHFSRAYKRCRGVPPSTMTSR